MIDETENLNARGLSAPAETNDLRLNREQGSLSESEESYRVVAETASDAIIKIDTDSRILFVNHAVERIFGYRVEEMIGQSLTMIMPENLRERHRAGFQRYLETGSRNLLWTGIEVPARHAKGHLFPLEISFGEYKEKDKRFFIGIARDISERKIAEQSLKDSSERYRALVEATSTVVWRATPEGELSFVGSSWENISGQRVEEVLGSGWLDAIHPDDRERTVKVWKQALASKEIYEAEFRVFTATSREYRWFSVRGVPVLNEDGSVREWIGANTDIHERKIAEEKLRESEANFRLLADISEKTRTSENPEELLFAVSKAIGEHLLVRRCLFNEIDLTRDRETVHRDYCRGVSSVAGEHRISDYSPITSADMQAGKTVVNRDSKTDARTTENYAKIYEPNGERAYIAVPLLRDNRWVASLWVSTDEPRDWSGQEISLLETVAERTWTTIEKLRINHALRESEERYRSLFETMDEGFCICEMLFDAENNPIDYRFLETNPAFERMTGLKQAEGKTARELLPNLEAHWFEVYGKVASTGEAVRFTDGSEVMNRWFDVYASRIGGDDSRRFALLFTNITDRRRAERERERLLESEQEARAIAEQANRAKDEFIALVSHELRSPLNAMLGWTRIMQKQQPDEETRTYALDVIVRNARAQSRLIEDLLDIARVGEKKLRLEMKPIELAPIINQAIEIIKPAAAAKNIRLSQMLDRAANFVLGDEDRLRQVLENLLSNAVKFTPDGGSVDARLESGDNRARIIISDTGQGFSPKFQPQMFERFKQADPSTTRRHGGLGIGLSLARDLVELHGGTISAESAGENKGATFTVSLPLRAIRPIQDISGKVRDMSSQGKLNGFWILAVDDEADAREIVSFMLQINGAKVTTANSAIEALDILKNADGRLPDVLLSDISMPNESGYALLEKIRALPEEHGGQIPAVALTAFNRPEDRQNAFDAGFQKHLGKPVEMDDLISAIIETAGK